MEMTIRNRMLKVLELARRGEGGERENAQSMLEKMLKKHGVTMADLCDEEAPKVRIFYKVAKAHLTLFMQCVSVSVHEWKGDYLTRKGEVGVDASRADHIGLEVLFTGHKKAFDAHMKRMADAAEHAYIQKNNLCPEKLPDGATAAPVGDIAAIQDVMRHTKRHDVHKQLPQH